MKHTLFSVLALFALCFCSCSDDKEEVSPVQGKWKYESYSDVTVDATDAEMIVAITAAVPGILDGMTDHLMVFMADGYGYSRDPKVGLNQDFDYVYKDGTLTYKYQEGNRLSYESPATLDGESLILTTDYTTQIRKLLPIPGYEGTGTLNKATIRLKYLKQ